MDTPEEFHGEIVYSLDVPDHPERILDGIARKRHALYDFGAMFYLGLRCLLPWLPKKNLWQCTGMDMCTEWATDILDGEPDSMITPYQLYQKLVASEAWLSKKSSKATS